MSTLECQFSFCSHQSAASSNFRMCLLETQVYRISIPKMIIENYCFNMTSTLGVHFACCIAMHCLSEEVQRYNYWQDFTAPVCCLSEGDLASELLKSTLKLYSTLTFQEQNNLRHITCGQNYCQLWLNDDLSLMT